MVEDRRQKPNLWDKPVEKVIQLPSPWKTAAKFTTYSFVFASGFFSGIAFVLMFIK